MRVRTRTEIDREKYALKTLRGDFNKIANTQTQSQTGKKQRSAQSAA